MKNDDTNESHPSSDGDPELALLKKALAALAEERESRMDAERLFYENVKAIKQKSENEKKELQDKLEIEESIVENLRESARATKAEEPASNIILVDGFWKNLALALLLVLVLLIVTVGLCVWTPDSEPTAKSPFDQTSTGKFDSAAGRHERGAV